jgi:transposase-like protein
MASVLNQPYFQDEEAAYAKLESIVWPQGPVCPHCGCMDRMKLMGGEATRPGLYKCYACRKQSRVTVGTVFESSHIKLHVWLQAAFLMCSSKKGISSNQLARVLGLTVKSAWFMSHRLREAMTDNGPLAPIGGEGAIVEADETYIGRKAGTQSRRGHGHKRTVVSLVERSGSVRSFHVESATANTVAAILRENADTQSRLMTDESNIYNKVGTEFAEHQSVNHSAEEYVRNDAHTQTIDGYFSIFKRGFKGIYQHCAEKNLGRYLSEFDFRYNNRVRLGVDDAARTQNALSGIVGKRLTYRSAN